jgi:hypothetical protein
MPAHPSLKEGDAKMITAWILSLGSNKTAQSLPMTGTVLPKTDATQKQAKAFTLTASYTDVGAAGVRPLTGSKVIFLRSNTLDAGQLNAANGFERKDSAGGSYLLLPATEGFIKLNEIDLTGIKSIELSGFGTASGSTYKIEVRKGSVDGVKIGESEINFGRDKQKVVTQVSLQATGGGLQDIFIICRKISAETGSRPLLKTLRFIPQ